MVQKMKLRDEFITHNTESESLLVPAGGAAFSGIVRGNSTFGAILELLKTETNEEGIVSAMCEQFDASEETIKKDVKSVLEKLRSIGAISE
jgi:hypothetical protein